MSKTLKVILSVVFCMLVGAIGAFFTTPAIPTWYAYLNKPFFSPPNWLFGPVWTILYILMGISFYLIWDSTKKGKNKKEALGNFYVQLILNFIWSPIFFGMKNLGLAFVVIVLMWMFILRTIQSFAKLNKKASYLLYPYIAWVSFASILNLSVWILNR